MYLTKKELRSTHIGSNAEYVATNALRSTHIGSNAEYVATNTLCVCDGFQFLLLVQSLETGCSVPYVSLMLYFVIYLVLFILSIR
jgi:hypothetical protein